jgi:hypothetical protein
MHRPDTVRIGDHDRPFEKAGFLEPCCARHFAIAIQGKPRTEYWLVISCNATRENRRNAGAHCLVIRQIPNNRFVTHRHAGDISNCVVCTGRSIEGNAKIASSRR